MDLTDITVSIIVAVFNVEKFLDRCIKSLIDQTYKNIEIILVDDGSEDHSNAICDSWVEKDVRIRVVHKPNGGLSDARNTGIEIAQGQYICFVDADDYIEKEMVEQSLKTITEHDADVVVYSNYNVTSTGKRCINNLISSKRIYSGKKDIIKYFNECLGTLPDRNSDHTIGFAPWGRLIKREIIVTNNIRFTSERILIYEDLMFLLDLTPFLEKVVILNHPLYDYCENSGSLTRKNDATRFQRISNQYWYLKQTMPYSNQLFQNTNTTLRLKRTMISYIGNSISRVSSYQNAKRICKDTCTKDVLRNYPIRKLPVKLRLFVYCLKYKLYYLAYIMIKLNDLKKLLRN